PNYFDATVSVLLNPGSHSGFGAALSIDGGTGTNQLNVDDSGGNAGDRIWRSATQITSPDVPFTINYQATGGNFNGGINVFTPASPGAAGQLPPGLAVADFNGDGKLDTAVVNYGPSGGDSVSVLLGNGNGGFASSQTLALAKGTNPFAIATGIFNNST